MKNKPSTIVCYKNGFSFSIVPVTLQGKKDDTEKDCSCKCQCQARTSTSSFTLNCLPDFVVQGTMDLEPDDPEKVKIISIKKSSVKNQYARLETPDPASAKISIHTFLIRNVGRQVLLKTASKEIQGKIKLVQVANETETDVIDNLSVMIETGKHRNKTDLVLKVSRIDEIQGITEEKQDDLQDGTGNNGIDITFQNTGSPNPTASLSYLTYNHIIWLPSYHITINQETNTLSLQGKVTLMCDESFKDSVTIPEIILCAGKPELENKKLNDSLVSNTLPLETISQNKDSAFLKKKEEDPLKSIPSPIDAAKPLKKDEANIIIEDEFEYKLENVELIHGQPTSMNFMEPLIHIPYEDVYHIEVKWKPEVKKAISLKNITGYNLTAGSASIVSKSETNNNLPRRSPPKLLSTANLRFTAKKDTVVIPMSPSLDVLAKITEEETEMKMEKIFKDWLKKFEVSTKVELENTLDKVCKCIVETNIPGELITSNPELAQKRMSPMKKQYDLHATTQYSWEVYVGPKQKSELTYSYFRQEIMLDDEKIPALYT